MLRMLTMNCQNDDCAKADVGSVNGACESGSLDGRQRLRRPDAVQRDDDIVSMRSG